MNSPPDKGAIAANYQSCDTGHSAGNVRLSSLPRLLTIETTSICNIKCVMCPHGLDRPSDKFEHFPEELADRLAGVIRLASIVQLHGLGEPLMNPAFWKMLELTHENQHVQINTNGLLLTDKNIDRILATHIGEISFSLDAARPETYRRIRGADFAKATGNLERLIAERNRRGTGKPHISMNMTLMRENIEETVEYVELAKNIGADQVQLWHMNRIDDGTEWRVTKDGWTFDYREQMLSNYPELSNKMIRSARDKAAELGIQLYLDWAKPVFYDEPAPETSPTSHAPEAEFAPAATTGDSAAPKDCTAPWHWMLIRTNGDVHPCCFGNGRIGNIRDALPEDVWNGTIAMALRTRLLGDDIHPVCSRGTCKFVNGRPAREESSPFYPPNIKRKIKAGLRAAIGDAAWEKIKKIYYGQKR